MAKKRLGLVIDLDRCIGCWTCAVNCKVENNVSLGNWWNRILSPGAEVYGMATSPRGEPEQTFMPFQCQHCANPPCVRSCPVGATYQREDGIVMQDDDKCIGCRTCMAACPYHLKVFNFTTPHQIPSWNDDHVGNAAVPSRVRHVVEKCSLCVERVDSGIEPACVLGCPAKARFFGDLNDLESEVSRLISERSGYQYKPEFGTDPSTYYLPKRRKRPLTPAGI